MREYWPASSGANFELAFGESLGSDMRDRISVSLRRTYAAMGELFDMELAGRDIIVVGSNAAELTALISENPELPLRNISREISEARSSRRGVSGSTVPGLLYVCIASDPVMISQIEQTWMDFFFAHEVTHLLQFQLGGAVRFEQGAEARLDFHGPVWLFEGIAQAFGNRVALGTPDWDFRIVNYNRLENSFPDLSALEYDSSLQSNRAQVYRAGSVGAIDLIDLFGYPSIARFYENLGRGLDWERAFEDAFGISVARFYRHYQSVERFSGNGAPLTGPLSDLQQ